MQVDLKEISLNDLYFLLWKGRYNLGSYWGDQEYKIPEEIQSREKDIRQR